MKLKKTLILSTIVLWTLASGAYAMYGQGNWEDRGQWMGQGHWFGKTLSTEQREKLQSMSMEDRKNYVQKLRAEQWFTTQQGHSYWKWIRQGHSYWKWIRQGQWQGKEHGWNPADMIKDIPAGTVDKAEKTMLINQYGEEKMARDLYTYAYEKYWIQTFSNISKAEQKHMDAVKALLDRYNISAPTDYAKDNELYNTLKANIDKSKKDAIEVGITVEMVDIDNMIKDIKVTDNDDIKTILTRIWWASYNHMRWFVKALNNAGYTTDLKWTNYLSEDDINTRGPLTYKLAEKLEKEGIDLPQSSQEIKEKCGKGHWNWEENWEHMWKWNWKREKRQERNSQTMQNISMNVQKYTDTTKVTQYKWLIEDKYASKINSYTQEQLQDKITKIDDLLEKIVNGSYSDKTKKTYTNVLLALKASLVGRLDTTDVNTDSILNSVFDN